MHHNNLALFNFNSQAVRVVVISNEPWFVAIDLCKTLEIANSSQAISRLDDTERKDGVILNDPLGNEKNHAVISESGMYSLVLSSRKPIAKPFKNWVTKEVLPSIRKTGKYEIKEFEKQFEPKTNLKEIDEFCQISGKRFGNLYEQRLFSQLAQKYYPHLSVLQPPAQEFDSLPSAKSWLTPTQLAADLGFKYKTGNLNPQAANSLLEKLGYQVKTVAGWSPTEKASSANLADRKPVDTGSRTQRDQLLWSDEILVVLSEFAEAK